jgi:hypothetical protein
MQESMKSVFSVIAVLALVAGECSIRPPMTAEQHSPARLVRLPTGIPAGRNATASEVTLDGVVVLVGPDHITLSGQGRWTRFLVPDDAMIWVNGAEASLDEVLPGQFASVQSRIRGASLVASHVDARRRY